MTREEQIKEAQVSEITKILDSNCEDIPDTVCQQYRCGECKARQIYDTGYRKQTHGEWVTTTEIIPHHQPEYTHQCTVCNYFYKTLCPVGFDYCPKCGARMKGGAE